MHYDFIEIGTSDFDTLIQECDDNAVGLSIEPIKAYLDNLPNKPNVKKVNAAVSDKEDSLLLYYIPPEDVDKYALPWWVKGSNSIGHPHRFTVEQLGETIYNKLVKIIPVPAITWSNIIKDHDVSSVDYIKIDTEGYDHIILNNYLDECDKNPALLARKIRFEARLGVSDMEATELLVKRFKGYSAERSEGDVVLTRLTQSTNKLEKAYVLYATESYYETVCGCVESLRAVSIIPIYVYMLNSDLQVEGAVTIRWECDIDTSIEQARYIDRMNPRLYNIMIQRPVVVLDCLTKYANTVAYIDSDSVATEYADTIFDMFPQDSNFPYFVEGIHDYLHIDGRGGAWSKADMTTTLEHPLCEMYGVDQTVRERYRQTGYFVAGQNCKQFILAWIGMCNNPEIKKNPLYYAPYHEETVVNVLLWMNNIQTGLPYIYINGSVDMIHVIKDTKFTGSYQSINTWIKIPDVKEHLLFYHGEKDKRNMLEMSRTITNKSLKILYLASHLSTGGAPQFLLKRLELLMTANVQLFVVEYNVASYDYVVQRNKIIDLVSNFYTLSSNKLELIDIIRYNNIDVVHLDETVEFFGMDKPLLDQLYSPNRTWRIIETCHNVGEGHNYKSYLPDAYAFCTPHHLDTFPTGPYTSVITYPIDDLDDIRINNREQARAALGFSPDKIHVINIGLWTKGKNQGEMIEIAKLYPDIEFHSIGNQAVNFKDYWEPLMQYLPENFHVWGERNDTDLFYQAADIFMFNSTFECNPLVLREAISYNLPIVARNLPEYKGMFDGWLYELYVNLYTLPRIHYSRTDAKVLSNFETSETFKIKHLEFYKKVSTLPVMRQKRDVEIIRHFVDNPFLEIKGDSEDLFTVRAFDELGVVHYQQTILANHWIKLNRRWFTQWRFTIHRNGELMYDDTLNLMNKRVFIVFESSALGDNIAWMPYAEEFRKKHKCHLVLATYKNFLFKKAYPQIEFVEPGTTVHNLYALYRIGWFYDTNREPEQPQTVSLQRCASNILGLEHKEIIPKIVHSVKRRKGTFKYITIATNSTAGCKFWPKEHWQVLINYLVDKGYKVINVSKEQNTFENAEQITDTSIENTMHVIHHSEFFIGISSGLSWLAWALGKHVTMIANFTQSDHEFTTNCNRVINTNVCHGCWNEKDTVFDKSDWDWCPNYKGTLQQWECHTSIIPDMVINKIKSLL